jgi:hypothetical protein
MTDSMRVNSLMKLRICHPARTYKNPGGHRSLIQAKAGVHGNSPP